MEAKDFSALRISLASPEQVRSWSYGEVTKPETINYRRLRPEMDGLFCERIFGPTRDWQCYCGKYKNIRYRGIICDKCGVEVTRSSVRRERMGHIELAAPVAHVWYTRRVPSYLGLLLDVSRRNLDRVLYFAQYVVTHVDEDARGKAIARIEKELQTREQELAGDVEEQMSAIRENRDQIAQDFDNKVTAIREHFDKELARLSDEVMNEAQVAQTQVENLLGQAAPTEIALEAASTVVVAKGKTIANEHISRIQEQVNEYLSKLQGETETLKQEEIQKISGAIDTANVDVDSSMEEHLAALDLRIQDIRASAEKQINELERLQSLQAYAENPGQRSSDFDTPFLSESRYRELKSKFGNVFQAGMGAEAFHEILSGLNLAKMTEMLWHELRTSKSKQRRRKATKRLRVVESLRSSSSTVVDTDDSKRENEPNGNRPEWMILTVLPVIPPDLRPMVQLDGGRFATSDLNDLYRRVINRNNRLKHLLDLGAPDVIVRNEKRMLQEAVDSLIDNSQRGKALSRRGRRELKSLSDMLKGKKGRFRRNLLGKRVDYSGRSVIVIGPQLKLHQCGLPKTMALELYRPFVISRLVSYNYASNVKGAKRIIERERPEVWEVLEEVIRERPVLLNRAPTLHRLGIQAFEPLLVEGKAIQIHPLVCSAFNADFDGDQMAVHVPLSEEAVKEARELMLSTKNLLKPSDGEPIVGPSKDMVLGNYYLTMDPTVELVARRDRADEFRSMEAALAGDFKVGIAARSNGFYFAQSRQMQNSALFQDETAPDENGRARVVKSAVDRTVDALLNGEVDCMLANAYEMRKYLRERGLDNQLEITNLHERRVVVDMDEVEYLYRLGLVDLHSPILLGNVYDKVDNVKDEQKRQEEPEICTVGRAIFNRILPDDMRFVQKTMDKKGLQELVADCNNTQDRERTTRLLDDIKNFGFHYATLSGTTIAISDLIEPSNRDDILRQSTEVVERADRDYRRGLMTWAERYQIIIDEWDSAKNNMQQQIEKEVNPYGPIAIMTDSGASKGGFGPMTQIAGMRGLMQNSIGLTIEVPIRNHFRQGLDAMEYFISTSGARRGLVDTALRTADAGYLTRRLVDVAQDMIVNRWDCNTTRGLKIRRDDNIAGQKMEERIVGRCAAQDIFDPQNGELIVARNEMIEEEIAARIQNSDLEEVEVRSPLTCGLINGVCALCYGRDPGTGDMVDIGAAVGIVAAQSIGEPGTQLTLRTFHASGATEGDITRTQVSGESAAEFAQRVRLGATNTGQRGRVAAAERGGLSKVAELFEARRPYREAVMTETGGLLRLSEREDGSRNATITEEILSNEVHDIPDDFEIVAEDGRDIKAGAVVAQIADKISSVAGAARIETDEAGDPVVRIQAASARVEPSDNGDNVPLEIFETVEEFFNLRDWEILVADGDGIEAGAVVAKHRPIAAGMAGRVHIEIEDRKVYIRHSEIETEELDLPANARLCRGIYDGMTVEPGTQLTEGDKNLHQMMRIHGAEATQLQLLSEIQKIFREAGVNTVDKHFETIIRKMLCKVEISDSGDSHSLPRELKQELRVQDGDLLPGELIERGKLLKLNDHLTATGAKIISGKPVLLGITKAALSTESYLSAASFQHTIKVLAGAAIEGQMDPLHGLKENVIIGKLIPAGTGVDAYHSREAVAPDVTLEAQGALDLDEVGDRDDFENILSEL